MLFLDTETTDYRPGQIAQLSYILADGDAITGAKNYYFAVDSMSPGAEMVHGLSREKLWILSGGKTFADQVDSFWCDFEGRMLVAHNAAFDLGFLDAEFSRCGMVYKPKATYCTMRNSTSICRIPHPQRGGYKWPRLEEALRKLEIPAEAVRELAGELFEGDESGFHDARFDAAAVYLIYRRLTG
ncbi:MAG: 3'-5' exonuclease [Candidatus Latescibacterota bacterium]